MKKFIPVLLLSGALLLGVTACKKDNAEASQVNTPNGTTPAFTCKIDGTLFIADSSRLNLYRSGFSIIAFKAGSTAFEINLTAPPVRTHSLAAGGSEAATYILSNDFFVNQSGNLTITAFDSTAKSTSGTFTFVGSHNSVNKTFTEGRFSISGNF